MKENRETKFNFVPTAALKERTIELIRESETLNYVEGIKLSGSLGGVMAREHARISAKYGDDHPRAQEAALRMETGTVVKRAMQKRFTEVSTPRPDAGTGWAVDGFVRTADGDPVKDANVAAYDRQERWHRELGFGCTDEQGYFSIVVEKLPDKTPRPVFMRASTAKRLVKSNVPELVPTAGLTDRVEIIIEKDDGKGDCAPPDGKDQKPDTPPSPARVRSPRVSEARASQKPARSKGARSR